MSQPRRSSDGFEVAPFLRACGQCKKKLRQDADIYMYRGEFAFCSVECRQEYMTSTKGGKKASSASKASDPPTPPGLSWS